MRCFEDAKTPLDVSGDASHLAILEELWRALSASCGCDGFAEFGVKSDGWKIRGFQTKDASSDLRGASVKCLRDLVFFVKQHKERAKTILKRELAMEGISSYPVIMGAIQISRMVTQMLGIMTLRQHSRSVDGDDPPNEEDSAEEKDVRVNSIATLPWWTLLRDPHAFEQIFSMAFILFDIRWGETNAGAMDFNKLMHECRLLMLSMLRRPLILFLTCGKRFSISTTQLLGLYA